VQNAVESHYTLNNVAENLCQNGPDTYFAIIKVGGKQIKKTKRRYLRCGLSGLASIFVATFFLGCQRCEDRGQIAMQAVLPQLNQAVVGSLVREASLCISNASAQPVVEHYYMPSSTEAPVAHGLKPVLSSEAVYGPGPTVVVHTQGASAPYMSVRVPVHTGAGLCLWSVSICIKPGGGFAKDDNHNWILEDRGTNATPVVKLSDEVLVYAEMRNL